MKTIELDFKGCKYIGAVHKVLKESFELPDFYGENLDALWDCLKYYSEDDIQVRIYGLSSLPENFKDYTQKMMIIFDMVNKEKPNICFTVVS